MNTRLPDRLHDLASDMPVDVEGSAPRVVRRARRRRATAALVATAAVVTVVVGGASALRVASPDEDVAPATGGTGLVTGPVVGASPAPVPPSGFAGVWPETTESALAEAQAAVDDGHSPLRVDPDQTAVMLATNLFGWTYDDTRSETVGESERSAVIELRNATFPEDVPPIVVDVAQLGRTGPDGIWSVVGVSSALFDDALGVSVPSGVTEDGFITVTGRVPGTPVEAIHYLVLRGPIPDEEWPSGEATIDGDAFELTWPADAVELENAVLWILVGDADRTFGALAIRLGPTGELPIPEPTAGVSPEISGVPVPAAVAETASSIQAAALDRDFDGLRALLDPMTFAYNFDDGSDPTPEWREDPSVLDTLANVLSLPPAVRDVEGFGEIYTFPYFIDEDLTTLDAREIEMLATIGVTEEWLQQMIDAGSGYLGPRTVIAADGRWLSYTTGGD